MPLVDPTMVGIHDRVLIYGDDGVGVPALVAAVNLKAGVVHVRPFWVGRSPAGYPPRQSFPYSAVPGPGHWSFPGN
jgi:hypothetical protein